MTRTRTDTKIPAKVTSDETNPSMRSSSPQLPPPPMNHALSFSLCVKCLIQRLFPGFLALARLNHEPRRAPLFAWPAAPRAPRASARRRRRRRPKRRSARFASFCLNVYNEPFPVARRDGWLDGKPRLTRRRAIGARRGEEGEGERPSTRRQS